MGGVGDFSNMQLVTCSWAHYVTSFQCLLVLYPYPNIENCLCQNGPLAQLRAMYGLAPLTIVLLNRRWHRSVALAKAPN